MDAEQEKPQTELLSDPKRVRSDCRLIERFGVPDAIRPIVVTRAIEILAGRMGQDGQIIRSKPRDTLSAIRAIVAIERLNMEQERRVAEAEEAARLQGAGGDDEASTLAEKIRKQVAEMDGTIRSPGSPKKRAPRKKSPKTE